MCVLLVTWRANGIVLYMYEGKVLMDTAFSSSFQLKEISYARSIISHGGQGFPRVPLQNGAFPEGREKSKPFKKTRFRIKQYFSKANRMKQKSQHMWIRMSANHCIVVKPELICKNCQMYQGSSIIHPRNNVILVQVIQR